MTAGAAGPWSAGAQAAQGASDAVAAIAASKQREKASKREIAEKRKQRFAELMNAALNRRMEAGESGRKRQGDMSTQRAQALQNMASKYVQAMR